MAGELRGCGMIKRMKPYTNSFSDNLITDLEIIHQKIRSVQNVLVGKHEEPLSFELNTAERAIQSAIQYVQRYVTKTH